MVPKDVFCPDGRDSGVNHNLTLAPRLPDLLKSKSNHCIRRCRSVNVSRRTYTYIKRADVFVELTMWDGDDEHMRVDVDGCCPVW